MGMWGCSFFITRWIRNRVNRKEAWTLSLKVCCQWPTSGLLERDAGLKGSQPHWGGGEDISHASNHDLSESARCFSVIRNLKMINAFLGNTERMLLLATTGLENTVCWLRTVKCPASAGSLIWVGETLDCCPSEDRRQDCLVHMLWCSAHGRCLKYIRWGNKIINHGSGSWTWETSEDTSGWLSRLWSNFSVA